MKERYKALIEKTDQGKKGTFGRNGGGGTGRKSECDLLISLTAHGSKIGAVNVRVKGEVAETFNFCLGEYVAVDYDNQQDGCLFVLRKTDPSMGCCLYKTHNEKGVRTSFTPKKPDLENLFSGEKRRYLCSLVHHDAESGACVFEEIKS